MGIHFFPNPAAEVLHLDCCKMALSEFVITLLDSRGEVLWGKRVDNYNNRLVKIDLAAVSKGCYFLKVEGIGVLM